MGKEQRNISVVKDTDGKNIVMINDIKFKGKRCVNWDEVEEYLLQYVGEFYIIASTKDVVFFGTDLPDEYAHSEYTSTLRGANAKAKANAAQGLGEMLEIAFNGEVTPNKKLKHEIDGANGWYRYESRFGLPVYSENGEVERYNVFHVYMIVRHDKNGRKYLYDIMSAREKNAFMHSANDEC